MPCQNRYPKILSGPLRGGKWEILRKILGEIAGASLGGSEGKGIGVGEIGIYFSSMHETGTNFLAEKPQKGLEDSGMRFSPGKVLGR